MRSFLFFTSFLTTWGLTEAGLLPRLFLKQAQSRGYADFLPRLSNETLGPRRNDPKYVFMHHIVGNTYDYTISDWKSDIQEIGSGGVDAIALNFGSDSWENEQLHNAYDAGSGSGVKFFLSFDFSVFPCDVNSVVNVVNQFAQHESSHGWQEIKDKTGGYLMPFIEGIEGQFGNWNCLDSWYCWGCAWPQGDVDKTVNQAILGRLITIDHESQTADDHYYISQIGSSTKYAATISPWIFTHYDYKNFYQRGDDWLIVNRWEQLIEMRDQLPMVEMVTWNDFGESSYFGHVKGLQPSGTTWADGYSHLPFFELSKYYITAFKTGHYPAISQDIIYFWARPHPAEAVASADTLARPQGYNFAEDFLWALVFATQSGQVTLTCGTSTQQFVVKPGINKLKIPLAPGKITVAMSRDGKNIINKSPSDFIYNASPDLYNYNVYVGSAKAEPGESVPETLSTGSTTHPSSTYSAGATPTPSSMIISTSQDSATPSLTRITSSYVSISTQAPIPSGGSWGYVGCVAEGTTGTRRALSGASYSKPNITPEKCQTLCAGYTFAGVEFGQECYCGNTLANNGANGNIISPHECFMPCTGDASKICGGVWTLNVYTTFSNIPSNTHPGSHNDWKSLGCYIDSTDRLLKGFSTIKSGMTAAMCLVECSDHGFIYAATEYGVECHCGNHLEFHDSGVSVDGSQCNMACDGDPSTKCGGSWRANVYVTSAISSRNLVTQKHHMSRKKRHY